MARDYSTSFAGKRPLLNVAILPLHFHDPPIHPVFAFAHSPEIINELAEQEVASQLPKTPFTRRGFVVTALGSGFAAAVMPVSAQTITTDTGGLEAGEVKIPVSDGQQLTRFGLPKTDGRRCSRSSRRTE